MFNRQVRNQASGGRGELNYCPSTSLNCPAPSTATCQPRDFERCRVVRCGGPHFAEACEVCMCEDKLPKSPPAVCSSGAWSPWFRHHCHLVAADSNYIPGFLFLFFFWKGERNSL